MWLPEPLLADGDAVDAATQVEIGDSLSMAFLVLLESLNPVERAVFLLREVFDYSYDEIAEIVDRTPDNCRQLAVRARRSAQERRPRYEASAQRRAELAQPLFLACQQGELNALKQRSRTTSRSTVTAAGRPRQWHGWSTAGQGDPPAPSLLSQAAELGLTVERSR